MSGLVPGLHQQEWRGAGSVERARAFQKPLPAGLGLGSGVRVERSFKFVSNATTGNSGAGSLHLSAGDVGPPCSFPHLVFRSSSNPRLKLPFEAEASAHTLRGACTIALCTYLSLLRNLVKERVVRFFS